MQVTTAIKRDGQPDVSFEYFMQQDGTSWQIIDIVADGASDLALKRALTRRAGATSARLITRAIAGRLAAGLQA